MNIAEIELQVRLGKLSLSEAMALAGPKPSTDGIDVVVKRNKSGGVYVVHPALGDRFGFNLTERVADFVVSDTFVEQVAPLIRALPAGCAPAK